MIKQFLQQRKRMKAVEKLFSDSTAVFSKEMPKVVCIDVGAACYPHPNWELFRRSANTQWVAVEPVESNLDYVSRWNAPSKIIPMISGLSAAGGEQILYLTNVPTGSSLLEPKIPAGENHRYDKNYFFPVKEIKIKTETLSDVLKLVDHSAPIVIKLDTQGSEFHILKALPKEVLSGRFVGIEMEITLRADPAMSGSSHFYEVQSELQSLGFELAKLKVIEGTLPNVRSVDLISNMPHECDAVFLMRQEIALLKGADFSKALLGMYLCYGLFAEAKAFFQKLKNLNVNFNSECSNYMENL